MLCCPGLKQDRKLFRDRIRVLISEPEPEPEPEPDPHSHSGAGTGPESLVRSRNRIRVLISDPEPHSYSGAGTVHEKLTLSATIHPCTRVRMPGGFALGAEPKPWKYERTKSPGGENFLRPLPPGEEISPGGPTL